MLTNESLSNANKRKLKKSLDYNFERIGNRLYGKDSQWGSVDVPAIPIQPITYFLKDSSKKRTKSETVGDGM